MRKVAGGAGAGRRSSRERAAQLRNRPWCAVPRRLAGFVLWSTAMVRALDPATSRTARTATVDDRAGAARTAARPVAARVAPEPLVPVETFPLDAFEDATSRSTKKSVERMLGRIGHRPGQVDGTFSANTRRSIETFQAARGLDATGYLDRSTLAALRRVDADARKGIESAGTAGDGVKNLERRLARLGYDVGNARDGVFSTQTADAVAAFKVDQRMKSRSGLAGKEVSRALYRESDAISHAPYRSRVKNTAAHRRADAQAERAAAQPGGVGVGDRGSAVSTIQRHLRSAGFDPKRTSGTFDERTEGMVEQFQRQSDLPVTGEVDARTWRHLRKAQMEATSATSPSQTKGERSGAVKSTERMLKKLGFDPGAADGLYDSRTQGALDRFRKAYHVGGRGSGVGKATLARLKTASERYVTAGDLTRIMPGLSRSKAHKVEPYLNRAMVEFGITTPKRQAAFLAQLGHESGSLKYFEEIASGAAYEGRTDLGNTHPGDGKRYKGRGPIQLTGRANYRAAGRALGLPLEKRPGMAARISVGFRTAGWFWKTHGLNGLADRGAFDTISRTINGGDNGLQDRRDYWARAKRVLGV